MKPAGAVLCLLVILTATSAAPSAAEDPGTPRPPAAHPPRLREVRFEGDLVFDRDRLDKILHDLEIRHLIPGIWTRRPLYEPRAVEAARARLRAFYVAHGYFDARVEVAR